MASNKIATGHESFNPECQGVFSFFDHHIQGSVLIQLIMATGVCEPLEGDSRSFSRDWLLEKAWPGGIGPLGSTTLAYFAVNNWCAFVNVGKPPPNAPTK